MESISHEPKGTYVVSNIDELRALLDRKRVVILRMLAEEPLTVKQLADKMGLVPASVHYHVKVLERSGLVDLVGSKEKSGILEKYYRSIAREFQVDPSLGSAPEAPGLALDALIRDMRSSISHLQQIGDTDPLINVQLVNVNLSRDAAARFADRIHELAEEFKAAEEPGAQEAYTLALAVYPSASRPARHMGERGDGEEG
ncbi:MAG TPA: winged helix-turn-helix domain-containing protein [Bacillota bacterium]|jgi:DNA-binding transcriptional ArsR family regulator|nr:winged helix-turn-helix domain-containing protein [Bacillota bacterium]